jgi:hypothetical protein
MDRLQRWATIAEIVAATAVVLSIIHLAVEVQRNTSAVQSQTSQGLLEMANQANHQIAANATLAELFLIANRDLGQLTGTERLQYRRHINSELNIWEHAFSAAMPTARSNGTMDDRLWNAYDISYRDSFCEESSNVIWSEVESFFGVEFRSHVDSSTEEDCKQTSFQSSCRHRTSPGRLH